MTKLEETIDRLRGNKNMVAETSEVETDSEAVVLEEGDDEVDNDDDDSSDVKDEEEDKGRRILKAMMIGLGVKEGDI